MPKGKKGSKGKKGKKGKKKGKKDKKKKVVPMPPPLHDLTTMYNKLIDSVEEFNVSRNKARKKRIEAWYMTREMMSLRHDNEIFHKHLQEKMEDLENTFEELTRQLNEEREAIEKIIAQRMEEMDRIISGFRTRSAKAEATLQSLKNSLLEFEPLMRELAGLQAKLRELQALIPVYELEANIKTRHLKNQYLAERSKLHNHLESELYKLVMTCRSHLMPILADHMSSMELENRCNRWELGVFDQDNFKLYRERENLLEKRNKLNMEREYLSIDWAFNKLAQAESKKLKERASLFRAKRRVSEPEEECELAVAFHSYLSKKLGDIERAKEREQRAKARREAREKRLRREQEKKRRAEILAKKRAQAEAEKLRKSKGIVFDETEEEGGSEDELGEWGELEYYEDEEGNWVIATPSRMLQHKAILENKAIEEVEQQVEDIKQMVSRKGKKKGGDEEGAEFYSGSSSDSDSSGMSGTETKGSLDSLSDLDEDEDQDEDTGDQRKSKKSKQPSDYGFGDFDDFGDDNFGGFDDGVLDD